MSVLHTRAKYFHFVPHVYRSLTSSGSPEALLHSGLAAPPDINVPVDHASRVGCEEGMASREDRPVAAQSWHMPVGMWQRSIADWPGIVRQLCDHLGCQFRPKGRQNEPCCPQERRAGGVRSKEIGFKPSGQFGAMRARVEDVDATVLEDGLGRLSMMFTQVGRRSAMQYEVAVPLDVTAQQVAQLLVGALERAHPGTREKTSTPDVSPRRSEPPSGGRCGR